VCRSTSFRIVSNSWRNSSGMQPVPVHRSRTCRSAGSCFPSRNRVARCVIEAAVSCLLVSQLYRLQTCTTAYRGMSTPGLHRISRSPKYSVPNKYCSGFPDALSFTRRRSNVSLANELPFARRVFATCSTCSRSHRSSFCAV
jgi:hypothetical protein